MKVILQQDVENVGRFGEVVEVADGYGRNYLIPRGLAVRADGSSVRQMEHKLRVIQARKARLEQEARMAAERLDGVAITIRRPTADEESERIFGSVTARDIAETLAGEGFEVDHRNIQLDEPIRQIGSYVVPIRFMADAEAKVKVYVIRGARDGG